MIRLILIRHGRTAWNVGGGRGRRFRGVIDLPLADDGVSQAHVTARRLACVPLSAVYSSPLQRALGTAQIVAQVHGLTAVPLQGLTSMDYGHWAGQLEIDVSRRWPDLYCRWRRDPFSIHIPAGESLAALQNRATAAVASALECHVDGETIAMITHQVVTKTLISTLTGMPNEGYWRFRQDLCNLTHMDYDHEKRTFTLAGLNDTCHLTSELPMVAGGSTRILMIRHGQTAWNAGAGAERFRGRIDVPLNEVGQAQACALADRLRSEPLVALYASPLVRAQHTIEPLAAALGLPVHTHNGLLDIDYGCLHGMNHGQAAVSHPELYALWLKSPGQARFPGGEGLTDIRDRLRNLFEELVARHPRQTIALVGHQVVNKVAVCMHLGLGLDHIWRVRQDTGSFNVFQRVNDSWYTLGVNDSCHLSGLAA